MKSCTPDEWADYLSQFRCYATEYNYGNHSIMYHKLSQGENVGLEIGEVHYCANGQKLYFIFGEITWN